MKVLKILDWPAKRYYGETHPLYKWRSLLIENDIKVEFYFDINDKRLYGGDYLMLHSRYFEYGWQNIKLRDTHNQAELFTFLKRVKRYTGRLIWFDAADSSGSQDFPLIPYVDVFLKKQILKDKNYYTSANQGNDLRIWLNKKEHQSSVFEACPVNQLPKIGLAWNLAYNDYRYFGFKMSRLSNYLNYQIYPLKYSPVISERKYDLAFHGTIHATDTGQKGVFAQRTHLLNSFKELELNIATGVNVSKKQYWKELRASKISVSPYGWGEICYRDFESMISGSILVKPSMDHLQTFPNVFLPGQTYVPLSWEMTELKQVLEYLIDNYKSLRHIGQCGQEYYQRMMLDGQGFVEALKRNIDLTDSL
ncbi:glycosyltransferase family 1 protein [Pedobacter sp. MC2016-24]|uniref:glycosyltransferase family 1 protein n=1 Tax=Pedobacter sp. MC2016-24 TaxID=2780090 RepID=UPI00187E08B2|nr:glycosyltransferase family 1 protein [Pedobacter sp. MC2016-24]MBE9601656.1 glycosyltransferase family 1 protein [Pedobacter sp. MC2016-24]